MIEKLNKIAKENIDNFKEISEVYENNDNYIIISSPLKYNEELPVLFISKKDNSVKFWPLIEIMDNTEKYLKGSKLIYSNEFDPDEEDDIDE